MTERDIAPQNTNTEKNGSDPEREKLKQLQNELFEFYTDETSGRKHAEKKQQLLPFLSALGRLTDPSDPQQLQNLLQIVEEQLGDSKFTKKFQQGLKEIFAGYTTEVATVIESTKEELVVAEDEIEEEIETTGSSAFTKLPKNEKQLLMAMVKGTYGTMLTDNQGNALDREQLGKTEQKEIKRLIALVQGVNMSSFFEAINAFDSKRIKGIEAIRSEYSDANQKELMNAWSEDGNLGRKYAQLAGYKDIKKTEQRKLAKLTKKFLEATDVQHAEHLIPLRSLLTHLQASTNQVNIDNERGKGAQYNERLQYAQVHAQAKALETQLEENDPTAGDMLDIMIADQDGDMSVDAEISAHQDEGYRAKKGFFYQLTHLRTRSQTRAANKEARAHNKEVKKQRKESASKQKEAGADILFEGQLKRSLDIARKVLNPTLELSEEQVDTKILQNLVGLVTQHYEQLVHKNVQIDASKNILTVLKNNADASATEILQNVFLKHPQTFGYLRGFLKEHHSDAIRVFTDGKEYVASMMTDDRSEENLETLENMDIAEPLLAKLDEQYDKLVTMLDTKVVEAKRAGAPVEVIKQLQAQQQAFVTNWPTHKRQLALNAMTIIGSTINPAQGAGLAGGVSAHLDNNWLQSITLGGGLFQGIGKESVAGTSLGVSLTFSGKRDTGKNKGGTLLYSLGGGTGVNRNALGFLQGFDIGAALGHERTINEKKLANMDPKAKQYFGAGFSASLLHRGIGPHLWLRKDRLLGLQEAEQKLLDPTKSLIEEFLNKNYLLEAQKRGKTLQLYLYEQLLAKKQGTPGGKKSSRLFAQTTNSTLENASRNLAVGLMSYYSHPDFLKLSIDKEQKTSLAESIARHHLLHWSMEHLEDLKEGLSSLHLSALDVGFQIMASGPAPLKIVGGSLTRYKNGHWSEDYHSREQVEAVKESGKGAQELPGTFGDAIDVYNNLLDTKDGTFTDEMKLTTTTIKHEGYDYPVVHIPVALFDYLRAHNGGVALQKLEMVFMKKDATGLYISTTAPSNLITVAAGGKNEYQLVIGDVGGVGKSRETPTNNTKVLYTSFDQLEGSIREDNAGLAERDRAVQEVNKDKYMEQFGPMFMKFMQQVNEKAPGFFSKANRPPEVTINAIRSGGNVDGMVKLPIDRQLNFFGGIPTDIVKTNGSQRYLYVPLNGTIELTKSTNSEETTPWKLSFTPAVDNAQGLTFLYGESSEAFTKSEIIPSEGFKLDAVQPQLIDFLKSREGANAMLNRRYQDDKRTPNPDHKAFYAAMQKKNFSEAATIAKQYVKASEMQFDASDTGKANLYTVYAELSRVDMTEFKDIEAPSQIKSHALELLTALHSVKPLASADKTTMEQIISDMLDSKTPVTNFMRHQTDIERILQVRYAVDSYNRDKKWNDPAYKLAYLLAPASVVDRTRTNQLLKRMENEPIYRNKAIRDDFEAKREQLFTSMDQAELLANIGTVQKDYLGIVFGYGDGIIDEKIIAHPPVMNFPRSKILYNKNNPTDAQHINYFVDNVKEKQPSYMREDMQGMINHLRKQLQINNLTEKSRRDLTAAIDLFEDKKDNTNEIASLREKGTFLNGTLPACIQSVTKEFSQTKYPKCINDMIIASPTKIFPRLETEQRTPISLEPISGAKVEPYTYGKSYVTTGVVGHRHTKDARTINILTTHGNLEKTYEQIDVTSKTVIEDLDTYLAGLNDADRAAFLAALGTEIQPGIQLDLGLGQGVQTYDGRAINATTWVVQDNSGPLPTMRLVNIVENKLINVSVLSNRQDSFIVKSNAIAAQNLRKLAAKQITYPVHEASRDTRSATEPTITPEQPKETKQTTKE